MDIKFNRNAEIGMQKACGLRTLNLVAVFHQRESVSKEYEKAPWRGAVPLELRRRDLRGLEVYGEHRDFCQCDTSLDERTLRYDASGRYI